MICHFLLFLAEIWKWHPFAHADITIESRIVSLGCQDLFSLEVYSKGIYLLDILSQSFCYKTTKTPMHFQHIHDSRVRTIDPY